MKLKALESYLGMLELFQKPKVLLEQYNTRPHISARLLYTIHNHYDDIENKLIADLGCGTGCFAIGASLLGAGSCVGYDVDQDALDICRSNMDKLEISNVELILGNVTELTGREEMVDVVITNPPFGTKGNEGMDVAFVKKGLSMANVVYSLHKTTTRNYIEKKAVEWEVDMEVVAELRFDLPQTYKFHKHKCRDVAVDFIRFTQSV